jgi:midasin
MNERFAIYAEIVDVFFAKLNTAEARLYACQRLARVLMISEDRVLFWETQRTLALQKNSETNYTIGRSVLSVNASNTTAKKHGTFERFAPTQQSLRLLEQLLVAVDDKIVEPVLLTGETGTGKTTTVQQLADIAGMRLHVINLSQQSDASDLLGGYKPVDIRSHIVQPIREIFLQAFKATFSVEANRKYLDACEKAFMKGEWKRLCAFWLKGFGMAKPKLSSDKQELLDKCLDI